MLRRLHHDQPESFAFTQANQAWAEAQITKYPEGREASAVIALLWRAQEQEGWLTRPAIEHVADMLGLAHIRALEVASFYFMFHLSPVGSVAHVQVCGTTPCMLCGSEDLVAVCRDKIAPEPFALSPDGKLSWEEVECLGACANAPMAQIGKDYYEDLNAESFGRILDDLVAGKVPAPGPQAGRFASEPASGLTSLDVTQPCHQRNASVDLATALGDTVRRIDGTEVPLSAPWHDKGARHAPAPSAVIRNPEPVAVSGSGPAAPANPVQPAPQASAPAQPSSDPAQNAGDQPATLPAARDGGPDDLTRIKGVGPKLEALLHDLGVFHFDQVAAWTAAELLWVDRNLVGFKGRASRDEWVEQARVLAGAEETQGSARARKDGDG